MARAPVLPFPGQSGASEPGLEVELPTERCIGCRAAKLGDGPRWNPPGRGAFAAQRSEDLQRQTGQLRGFTLEDFTPE
eukprot:9491327-Alexandrium_andersonii.AAC.1